MIVDKEALVPNALSIPSRASFVVCVKSDEEIVEANSFAKKEGLPLIPLGDGTNIVPNDYVKAVVAVLDTKGIEFDRDSNHIKIQAGENWDDIVKLAVENNLSGLETLSAIPGRAGAAPIQNIGAYGAEVSEFLEKVEVYDKENKGFRFLNKKECQFGYRDSLFKKYPERFIITSVSLKLSQDKPKIPDYKDAKNYFNERNNPSPNLREIREAIIEIRKNKLPDPRIIPNVGSYFTNPIVEPEFALTLKNKFPEMPTFPFHNKTKIPAGWLIEQFNLKGAKIGKVETYKNNALVLTNPNKVSFNEIQYAENFIKKEVFTKFGILLEREPRII